MSQPLIKLYCPTHHEELAASEDGCELHCSHGCNYPVVNGIPRFVASEAYAAAFGIQWRKFRKTQLDSFTGTTVSRDRLTRCLGGDLEVVKGRTVLEAGCGAGRFTEVLENAGAIVLACDISSAVDANMMNCRDRQLDRSNCVKICQASILALPAQPQSFDFVICLGVIQHTPDPTATIKMLATFVKPGGVLVIDHYSREYDYPIPRKIFRHAMLMLPPMYASRVSIAIARTLCVGHRLLWRPGTIYARARRWLRQISPLVDYYDSYPQLSRSILAEWCVLDTHDTVTDVFKHLRTLEEVTADVRSAGLETVVAASGGNGVEIRAIRSIS